MSPIELASIFETTNWILGWSKHVCVKIVAKFQPVIKHNLMKYATKNLCICLNRVIHIGILNP